MSLVINTDNTTVISGGDDKSIRIWSIDNGKQLKKINVKNKVWGVAISQNGKEIATSGKNNTVQIWNVENGELLRTYKGHTEEIMCLTISNNEKFIASGSMDNTIKIWNF